MREAENSLNVSFSSNKSTNMCLQNLSESDTKTVEASLDSPTAFSTPLLDKHTNRSADIPTQNKTLMYDKAVETPFYLDLNVQLEAVGGRCITLEKSLLEAGDTENKLKEKIVSLEQQLIKKDEEIHNLLRKIDSFTQTRGKQTNMCQSPTILVNTGTQTNEEKKQLKTIKLNLDMYDRIKILEDNIAENRLKNKSEALKLHVKEKTTRTNKPKLTVISDSQGRDLAGFLQTIVGTSHHVTGNVYSGGYIEDIVKSATRLPNFNQYTMSEAFILLAGSNNVSDNKLHGSYFSMDNFELFLKKLEKTFINTNLIFSTIPYRYDLDSFSWENVITDDINCAIRAAVSRNSNFFLLDTHLLPRHCHGYYGFHLNNRGKEAAAREICNLLSNTGTEETIQTKLTQLREKTSKSTSIKQSILDNPNTQHKIPSTLIEESGISVLNANMYDVIGQLKDNPSVAFAHSISNDFEHDRHMSAGVAVVFRKSFGRPQRMDCISRYLARQKPLSRATIYSLVTKNNFHDKPTLRNYNLAFQQLQKDFKVLGLKTLVCSAIGCVRDKIDPEVFAKNIVEFYNATGASIYIISQEQKSAQRPLWKGLTHQQFLQVLEEQIQLELRQQADKIGATTQEEKPQHPQCEVPRMMSLTDFPLLPSATTLSLSPPPRVPVGAVNTKCQKQSTPPQTDSTTHSSVTAQCTNIVNSNVSINLN